MCYLYCTDNNELATMDDCGTCELPPSNGWMSSMLMIQPYLVGRIAYVAIKFLLYLASFCTNVNILFYDSLPTDPFMRPYLKKIFGAHKRVRLHD